MKKTTLLLALTTLVCKHMKTQFHSPAAPARMARALAHLLARRACLWAALGFAALSFVAYPAPAAVTEAWVHRYSNVVSNSDDQAVKVVRDAAGDIIVTGTTDDGTTGGDRPMSNRPLASLVSWSLTRADR